MAALSERSAAADDFSSQELWRRTRAILLSRRGEHARAEELAREAVGFAGGSDYTFERAETHRVLGEVLEAAGRTTEAAAELRRAVGLLEEKGAVGPLEPARANLARLDAAAGSDPTD